MFHSKIKEKERNPVHRHPQTSLTKAIGFSSLEMSGNLSGFFLLCLLYLFGLFIDSVHVY